MVVVKTEIPSYHKDRLYCLILVLRRTGFFSLKNPCYPKDRPHQLVLVVVRTPMFIQKNVCYWKDRQHCFLLVIARTTEVVVSVYKSIYLLSNREIKESCSFQIQQ